jgi:hypothetical protein
VTVVDKDATEKLVKVRPIGMSMLEGPQEKDKRLEGHLLLLKSFVHFGF